MDKIEIRDGVPSDRAAIERLYREVFPDEDLLPLVQALLRGDHGELSLVALVDASLAGHVVFTPCGVTGAEERVALLGPLAVFPDRQRCGVGRNLIETGLQRLAATGVARVCVLGDPAYYGRFGFCPERSLAPPYPLPEEWRDAWQSIGLGDPAPRLRGTLAVPPPWRQPDLWA